MKLAIIADIHGNASALEAVISDLAGHSFDAIVHLGDAFNGPIDPAGVADILRQRDMIHVRGNGERMVLSTNPAERTQSAVFASERLERSDLEWISTWPNSAEGTAFFACHGSPSSDVEYLLEEPLEQGVRLSSAAELASKLEGRTPELLLCAHSHVPRLVRGPSSTLIINPGSVGLPAYSLQNPRPHKMEVGSPEARYATAEKTRAGWRISHLAIPYDWERAAQLADQAGFYGWATALRTGYAV